MLINNAWYVSQLPTHIVVELPDYSLAMFRMVPYRAISESDLEGYTGYHPRKMRGMPVPEYVLQHYGITGNAEKALTETVRTRISKNDSTRLEEYAKKVNKSPSEIIREYIRSL